MNRLWIVLGLITATCFFAFGYWTGHRVPINQVQYIDRVVVQHSEKHDDIVTQTERKVTKPSGVVIESKTTKVDKSVTNHSQTEREKVQTTTAAQANSSMSKSDWRIGIYLPPRYPVTSYRDVSVEVTHRLVGPLSVGAQVSLKGDLLVGVLFDF